MATIVNGNVVGTGSIVPGDDTSIVPGPTLEQYAARGTPLPSTSSTDTSGQRTVLSSETPTNDYIPDLNKRLNTLTDTSGVNRSTYTGEDGFLHYNDDSSMVQAPVDAQPNEQGNWESNGASYGTAPHFSDDPTSNALETAMLKNVDASTRASIASIKQMYDVYKTQQQDVNKRYEASVGQTLLMGGTSRYAQLNDAGLVNTAMTYGVQELASLDAQEQQLIQKAKDAQSSKNYEIMSKALSQAENIRAEKAKTTEEMNKKLVAANEAVKKQNIQSSRDDAVAGLLQQGITDPKQILDFLNYNESGKKVGDFTAKEVSETLKSLTADNPQAKAIMDILDTARNNGATPDVLSKIAGSSNLNAALSAAGKYSSGGSGIVGEYNYAKANGYTGTFSQYQNEDANRKAKATGGGGSGFSGGFTAAMQGGKVGSDLLNTLSAVDKATVKSILDYTKNPANLSLRKSAGESQSEREKFLAMAHLVDPTYDESQYAARAATKKDFMSGKAATNIKSLNTAIAHLDVLKSAADGLNNAGAPLWNLIKNKGLTQIGDSRVVKFNNAATAVENELASVFKGTGATDQEIKQWRDNLSSSQSPDQLHAAIDTAIELMSGRIAALQAQYENGMGKPKDFKFLSGQSRQILTNLGVDPNAVDPSLPSDTSTADGIVGSDRQAITKIQQFHDASPENAALIDELHTKFPDLSAAEIAEKLKSYGH